MKHSLKAPLSQEIQREYSRLMTIVKPLHATARIWNYKGCGMLQLKPNIRPLQKQDVEVLGDLYFPCSIKQDIIEKWRHYL